MKSLDLHNKVVVVTGAARGIGAALCKTLTELDAIVVGIDRPGVDTRETAAIIGGRGMMLVADVTIAEEVQSAVQVTIKAFRRIDVLVANAGIERIGSIAESPAAEFQDVIAVNLLGVYNCIKETLPEISRNQGHITAISSIAGIVPWPYAAAYGASKAAVDSFMRSLRIEMAPTGATAGAMYFGHIRTDMMVRSHSDPLGKSLLARMPKSMGMIPVSPEKAARATVRQIQSRRARGFSHFSVRLALWMRGIYQALDPLLPGYLRVNELSEKQTNQP